MTSEAFTYWLKGFFELENPKKLNEKQTLIIKDHLDLVFDKVTPNRNDKGNKLILENLSPKKCSPNKRGRIC